MGELQDYSGCHLNLNTIASYNPQASQSAWLSQAAHHQRAKSQITRTFLSRPLQLVAGRCVCLLPRSINENRSTRILRHGKRTINLMTAQKTKKTAHSTPTTSHTTTPASAGWRPQPCGLSREELRAIVAEIMG
jgi:hypothetical protein